MSRRYALFLGGASVIFITCGAWVHAFAVGAVCAGAEVQGKGAVSLGQLPLLEIRGMFLVPGRCVVDRPRRSVCRVAL